MENVDATVTEIGKNIKVKNSRKSKKADRDIFHTIDQKQEDFQNKYESLVESLRHEVAVLSDSISSVNLDIASLKLGQGNKSSHGFQTPTFSHGNFQPHSRPNVHPFQTPMYQSQRGLT